jgi:type I restriction enzyme S subunit
MKVEATLGSLVEIFGGRTPSRDVADYFVGTIPWVSPKDMKTKFIERAQESISEFAISSSATRLIPANSVLVVVRSGVLKHSLPVAINLIPVAINQDMKALVCGPRLEPRYLAHFLRNAAPNLLQKVRGTTADNIPVDELRKLNVPLPSLDEQRRIAKILDKADELRQRRRVAVQKFDSLAQSLYLDMFGDPVANRRSLPKKPLRELIDLKSGDFLPASAMQDGPYPVYGGNGVSGYHHKFMFDVPKIVIGRVGVYCGAIHVAPAKSWVTDNALYVAECVDGLDFTFLAESLRLANLNQYAGQAAQPLISGTRVYPVEILMPGIRDQLFFGDCCNLIKAKISQSNESHHHLGVLFNALQEQAFNGQL